MATVTLDQYNNVEELVLMSVGTNKGSWWADTSFGSDLYLLRLNGKITANMTVEVERVILDSLQWLIDDALVESVSCSAEIKDKTRIDWVVTVVKNGQESNVEGVYGV